MTSCEMRLAAARVIEERGWIQGNKGNKGIKGGNGPVCLLGAIAIVAGLFDEGGVAGDAYAPL